MECANNTYVYVNSSRSFDPSDTIKYAYVQYLLVQMPLHSAHTVHTSVSIPYIGVCDNTNLVIKFIVVYGFRVIDVFG